MKSLFIAHTLLIDCGKASSRTRGQFSGVFSEGGSPPFVHWNG
jgi:hypothetical protein